MEEALRAANETLEQRVAERTLEVERSYERVRQSERLAAIGQMIAGLSHESRNALQRSTACLQLLDRHLPDLPRERTLVREALKAHEDLQRVYDDVQEYAAEVRLERVAVSVPELWRDAWRDLESQRQGRIVSVIENIDGACLECWVDPFRVKRVFRILFENSLDACSDPVEILVACTAGEVDGKAALRIRVQDNGPGLNAEQAHRLFEPFYTTKVRGTGLGMSIARRLVEGHGGSIAIDPRPGQGLEVTIDLPCG
jgi:signal transduction histidine kinase